MDGGWMDGGPNLEFVVGKARGQGRDLAKWRGGGVGEIGGLGGWGRGRSDKWELCCVGVVHHGILATACCSIVLYHSMKCPKKVQ